METPDPLDRLTLLERAQLLHDATLRRHGEMLDGLEDSRVQHEARLAQHAASLAQHEAHMARLDDLAQQQTTLLSTLTTVVVRLEATNARLEATLEAILDLLRRGQNGH